MSSTTPDYEPSLRSSIASHGNDDFFGDQPSALGLQLSSEPIYKGPFSDCSVEPTIPHSTSVRSFAGSADSSQRVPTPLERSSSSYFEQRPDSELPASSLPPLFRPEPKPAVAKTEFPPVVAPRPVVASVPSNSSFHGPSAENSRPPSIVLSRPNSTYRPSRPPSRARSLAEEIADVGEEVPKPDLDDSDDDVSWAAVLGGPSDVDRFLSRANEQSFERQRAAFPPPRSRTSSILSYNVSSRLRTPSFISSKTPASTPPRTPDNSRPKYAARHSFHVDQLSRASPSSSLAPPSPDERISPKRASSISGLASLRSLRSFRSNRRGSGKGEPEVADITVPAGLTAADLPSPVPELPNEQNDGGSAPSSTHSRESTFYPRFGLAPVTPTRDTRKPRLSLAKMPKVFRKNSNPNTQIPTVLTSIETTEEIAPNGDIIERTYTTTRRPSASSRLSWTSRRSEISNASPKGSAPGTPGTPDQYVENSPIQYVTNTSSRPPSVPATPSPARTGASTYERKEIKPIMIVDYANLPSTTYRPPPSPQKAATPGGMPSRSTAPGPPVRSLPSTPNDKVERSVSSTPSVAPTVADGPVPPLPDPIIPSSKVGEQAAAAGSMSTAAASAPASKAAKTHISVGRNASIDITTALSEGPKDATAPAASSSPIPMPALAESEVEKPPATSVVEIKDPKTNVSVEVKTGGPAPSTKAESRAPSVKTASPSPKAASLQVPSPKPASAKLTKASDKASDKVAEDAKSGTQINIDPKKRSFEVVTTPTSPEPHSASFKAASNSSPKASQPKKNENQGGLKTLALADGQATIPPIFEPNSRSRSPSIRSMDARVLRSRNGDEVVVTFTSQSGGHDVLAKSPRIGDVPKERMKHPKEHYEKEVQREVERRIVAEKERLEREKDRMAEFIPFDRAASVPVTPEKQRVRPEHVKHHSVDSVRSRSPHNSHLHAKHHSLDVPRYPRSVSYDHAHTPSHLNVSHWGLSSRRNSIESNASFATIDSSGVLRKRRVLNPMKMAPGSGSDDDADNSDSGSDTDGEARNSGVDIDYHETESSVAFKVSARVSPTVPKSGANTPSGAESNSESDHQELRNELARADLHRRIQAAQRLMKENPRLPSEIDDVPASLPPGAMPHVPPQHWPRPAPHPALRPLYLGGRAFGAPVSTGMMPGLGYAAGQLGGSSYLGMPIGPVPMMLARPAQSQPGWYPARPRP